ncbi:MAG: radical SAM protein [Acidimicrobiales bacterium]|nr:radical SAM protein [Hyphomonadaceae bacterium]RZV36878.1 MAG: radical SAM protein [Acidimicrobiales bacterium]
MNILNEPSRSPYLPLLDPAKFQDPDVTAKGEERASVQFTGLKTLWFNTGSLCNIECANCYIASSPTADHFVYLTPADMAPYLDEIETLEYSEVEIAFTGGEPYLNPYIIELSEMALKRGHELLVLTNAMKPMMRPRVQKGLLELNQKYAGKMTLRVSLDHFSAAEHDRERGVGSFDIAMTGMRWLSDNGFKLNIAGRAMFAESDEAARAGYAQLIKSENWQIDAYDKGETILFPEMDEKVDVPEIATACWDILDVSPNAMMCSNSRMVVRRKGAHKASVLACTLLWDDDQFELGPTLAGARNPVKLNHPHCAKFCVLGGASCSA